MNRTISRRKSGGFSLIELLVVIAIILVLSSIIISAVQNALVKARITSAINLARNCYLALMTQATEGTSVFPASPAFATSTDYWRWLISSNRYYDVTYAACAAYGVAAYDGTNSASFSTNNNAWCFVANINDQTPSSTPVMFSRNLNITSLNTPDFAAALTTDQPFGQTGVVVVRLNGQAEFVKKADINVKFNPTGAVNPVIRP